METALCLVLALFWGAFWAVFLQCTGPGRFLAARRAWLAVAIGIGVDLLILLVVLPVLLWLQVGAVVGASALGLIARSLWNEWNEHLELVQGLDDGQQDEGRK